MQVYQQGDMLLTRIEVTALPGRKEPGLVLATGEATGHHHTAAGEGVVLRKETRTLYLGAPNGAEIVHPEHRTIRLPPGNYRIDRVQEYDHFGEQADADRGEALAKMFGHSSAATRPPQPPLGPKERLGRDRNGRPVRD